MFPQATPSWDRRGPMRSLYSALFSYLSHWWDLRVYKTSLHQCQVLILSENSLGPLLGKAASSVVWLIRSLCQFVWLHCARITSTEVGQALESTCWYLHLHPIITSTGMVIVTFFKCLCTFKTSLYFNFSSEKYKHNIYLKWLSWQIIHMELW